MLKSVIFELSGVENGDIEPKMRTVALIGPEISICEQVRQFWQILPFFDPSRPNFETPDRFSCLEVLFLRSVGSKMGT